MLKLLETANNEFIPARSSSLGIDIDIFSTVAKRCGFEVILVGEGTEMQLKLRKKGIPVVKLYDIDESDRFDFLDISDLHVGNPGFSEDTLKRILDSYTSGGNDNRKYVFIAGDLIEGVLENGLSYYLGVSDKIRKNIIDERNFQIRKIFNILRQYDTNYIAINGNHEYTYEQLGFPSALKELECKMKSAGYNFKFYDTYIMDFIIAGVVKRIMHLESYMPREGAIPAYDRLLRFQEHGGLNSKYNGFTYPIRFLTCGHIHKREILYDTENKVYICQPGSFVKKEMLYEPSILFKGTVLPDKRILLD